MAEGYETARVAVDPVIFTILEGRLSVILSRREKAPYRGRYELPGGLVLRGENPKETLKRKLKQLFGTEKAYFTQFETFAEPKRDPRRRTVSIGFIALVRENMVSNREAWFPIRSLPPLAFDHNVMIGNAFLFLRNNINTIIAKQFLPEEFPLNQLQKVYEVIKSEKYDNRNFRKKMINDGVVVETGMKMQHTSHRPPRLYRFK